MFTKIICSVSYETEQNSKVTKNSTTFTVSIAHLQLCLWSWRPAVIVSLWHKCTGAFGWNASGSIMFPPGKGVFFPLNDNRQLSVLARSMGCHLFFFFSFLRKRCDVMTSYSETVKRHLLDQRCAELIVYIAVMLGWKIKELFHLSWSDTHAWINAHNTVAFFMILTHYFSLTFLSYYCPPL